MQKGLFPSEEYRILDSLKPFLNYTPDSRYPGGIGDDAVVRNGMSGERTVLTADVSVEEVHFSRRYMSLDEIGYRAMVGNISDCAAMGAVPDGALVQLVFPGGVSDIGKHIKEVYRGFYRACSRWGFPIIGGDLSSGPQWVLAITLLGRIAPNEGILFRKGVRAGDFIWVSGNPGGSRAGLEVLQRWGREAKKTIYDELISAHIQPAARVELGRMLAKDKRVHAAIDISDGVAKECRTLAYDNHTGIELSLTEEFPTPQMRLAARELGADWYRWVLEGGEDYELLFAADPSFDPADLEIPHRTPLFRIGRCFGSSPELVVRGARGEMLDLGGYGWDHFNGMDA